MLERVRHGCGVFGIYGVRNAAQLTYLGLYALQHRGQESAGIVSSDGHNLHIHRDIGEVNEVFGNGKILKNLKGKIALGHNRYSTTGASIRGNIQPILIRYRLGHIAVAHNGNLTNYHGLRREMERSGSIFQSTSDSEIFLHLIAQSQKRKLPGMIKWALSRVKGAYSLCFLTENSLIAARDPCGFRPLALGKFNKGWVVASETCAFDIIGARYIRDIQPGEILAISEDGLKSYFMPGKRRHAFCIFEFVYFARPDSKVFGENVDKIRRRLGWQLAEEKPCDADIVISVPDSSNTATLGYSEVSGIKYEVGLIRNHYVGRTFIMPDQKIRDLDVLIKFNPVKGVLKRQKVLVVDDSIVRGTTSKKLIKMIRESGAKEVHMRISSPPITSPCFYGIDMPTKKELIGSNKSVRAIGKYLGVDSLGYLSLKGMLSTPELPHTDFCTACFSGSYPVEVERYQGKLALDR